MVESGTRSAPGPASVVAGWAETGGAGEPVRASFAPARLAFPLVLRGWRPGDRIRLPYGTKKLKKLLAESRIPVSERGAVPVLADAGARVLWIPGLAARAGSEPAPGEEFLQVEVWDGGGR